MANKILPEAVTQDAECARESRSRSFIRPKRMNAIRCSRRTAVGWHTPRMSSEASVKWLRTIVRAATIHSSADYIEGRGDPSRVIATKERNNGSGALSVLSATAYDSVLNDST